MAEARDAVKQHGSAVDAVLNEATDTWPIEQTMLLWSMMAKEIAAAEKGRRNSQTAKSGENEKGTTRGVDNAG